MSYALTVGTITFLMTVIWGGPLIQILSQKRIGKQIRVEGPSSHIVKSGTPTMGGLLIIIPGVVITVVANLQGRYSILLPLGCLLYTSDAADDLLCVDLGGRRII